MKHLLKFFPAVLSVLLAMTACDGNSSGDDGGDGTLSTVSWNASLESFQAATRAAIASDFSLEWSSGDAVSVFSDKKNYYVKSSSESGSTAVLSGEVALSDSYVALFPYDEEATSNNDNVTAYLDENQELVAGGIDPEVLLCVAKADNSEMKFRNMVSVVGLKFAGEVETLALASPSEDDYIAGRVRFNSVSGNAIAITGTNRINLLGEVQSGKTYYVSLIPGEYAGLTVTATNSKKQTAEIVLEKNTVKVKRNEVTVYDADFSDVEWFLRPPTSQSYVLEGAAAVKEFLELLPNPKESVINITLRGQDITDELIAQLCNRIGTITGNVIWDDVGATTTAGFFDKIACQGSITLKDCNSLKDLSGFDGITSVNGDLTIENCNSLKPGFNALESVAGMLTVKNTSLTFGESGSFASLKAIGGSLVIEDNANVASFAGSVLSSIGKDITITGNKSLISLSGMDKLTIIGGDIVIIDNGDIPTISDEGHVGYCIVREYIKKNIVSGSAIVKLGSTDSPIDIDELPSCDGTMPGDPESYVLHGKTEVDAFVASGITKETVRNLTIIGLTDDDIDGTTLRSITQRVSHITGTLTIQDIGVVNESGWGVGTDNFLESFTYDGVFEGSIVLKNLAGEAFNPNGFVAMREIKGSLIIEDCPGFCMHWGNTSGLALIEKIGGDMKFINSGVDGWYDGTAWANLKEVGGDFVLEGLKHLYFLKNSNITRIGGSLTIKDCPSFWGLNGFENLTWLGGDVTIANYGKLQIKNGIIDGSDCVGICLLRDLMDENKMNSSATVIISKDGVETPFSSVVSCSATATGDKGGSGEKFDDSDNIDGWK